MGVDPTFFFQRSHYALMTAWITWSVTGPLDDSHPAALTTLSHAPTAAPLILPLHPLHPLLFPQMTRQPNPSLQFPPQFPASDQSSDSNASVVTAASDTYSSPPEQPSNEQPLFEAALLKETASPLSDLMLQRIHHNATALPPVRPTSTSAA